VASRKGILDAVVAADRLHQQFDSRRRAEQGEGRVDIFGMLGEQPIFVLFRPLSSLLGAYINDPDKGILVTTQRPLRVQRFTAAHELGHAALGHETSMDGEEILGRAAFFDSNRRGDSREVEANVFASELLTPPWLIFHHMKRQGWTREHFADPAVVYQLSLRLGSSYAATCFALGETKAINNSIRDKLLKVPRRTIKESLVKPYKPKSWHGDVWVVTERDSGSILDGSRVDLVVVKLPEHASSGYVWQFGDLAKASLGIVKDERTSPSDRLHIGGIVFRTVIAGAQTESGASGSVNLREVRPWMARSKPLNSLNLNVQFSGPVTPGMLPKQRAELLGIA
jgi:Zn-dependent peptidase ImmA (M78 family)